MPKTVKAREGRMGSSFGECGGTRIRRRCAAASVNVSNRQDRPSSWCEVSGLQSARIGHRGQADSALS